MSLQMSLAHPASPGLQSAALFELGPASGQSGAAFDGMCSSLINSLQLNGALDSPYAAAAAPASGNLAPGSPYLGGLLGATPHSSSPADALAQLAALQQQQQLVAALEAEPLLSLTNLLAAQNGLNARVHELLMLKQQLSLQSCSSSPSRSPGSHGGIRGTGPMANPLYKTELCRSWEETGSCRYGAKCQFAHGREELRPVVRHPKYKTEVCRTFAQSGTCPYGTRCRFIHTTAQLAPPCSPSGFRAGSATPTAGSSAPHTPNPSRHASFSSLRSTGAATPLSTPGTPPLPPTFPRPTGTGAGTPMSPALCALFGQPATSAGLLGARDSAAAVTAASLLGVQGMQGSMLGQAALGSGGYGATLHNNNTYGASQQGSYNNSLDAYNATAQGNYSNSQGYGAPAPASACASYGNGGMPSGRFASGGGDASACSNSNSNSNGSGLSFGGMPSCFGPMDADTMAALATLLAASAPAPAPVPGPPASPPPPPPLTTSAASVLGVVGPPSGLAPISRLGQQASASAAVNVAATPPLPSCPSTPVGTPSAGAVAAMRRSISDSDASTPGGSAKRLPFFERLIPEGCERTSIDGGPAASSAASTASAP